MITSHGTCKENLSNNQWGLKLVIISFFLVMLMSHSGVILQRNWMLVTPKGLKGELLTPLWSPVRMQIWEFWPVLRFRGQVIFHYQYHRSDCYSLTFDVLSLYVGTQYVNCVTHSVCHAGGEGVNTYWLKFLVGYIVCESPILVAKLQPELLWKVLKCFAFCCSDQTSCTSEHWTYLQTI